MTEATIICNIYYYLIYLLCTALSEFSQMNNYTSLGFLFGVTISIPVRINVLSSLSVFVRDGVEGTKNSIYLWRMMNKCFRRQFIGLVWFLQIWHLFPWSIRKVSFLYFFQTKGAFSIRPYIKLIITIHIKNHILWIVERINVNLRPLLLAFISTLSIETFLPLILIANTKLVKQVSCKRKSLEYYYY